ncbi:hypothetical protein SCLCIDRAFT_1220383 [Scleroderma citrinum Foug A]|uniref:GH3 auxin-responsive promoter n=1 Tax=Scleroderma citrinum Foug A TaxID=1036808 RepID=A0A0C2Z355_9AGAM|nr:hypothetical protein SCLCIDRAFT_1220383 [Scleroderma citrinum Foug A]
MSAPRLSPLVSLPPQISASLKEETDSRLQKIIRANITSRYACSSSYLANFRLAIADKDVKEDYTLSDFRRLVPLTDYGAYRPWLDKFMERPCKLSEVENLLAPGLPNYFGVSSSTSGSKPKHFARYFESNVGFGHAAEEPEREGSLAGTTAWIFSLSYRDIVDVTTESGEVVKRIPVCIGSAGFWRNSAGWPIETDNTRMASMIPGLAAPWATSLISHHRSFLLIHALFALADRNVERIATTFVTFFIDLVSYVQEEWDMLLSSIRDGVVPNIEHIDHVRDYLQINMHADPQRAEELRSIGPPFSCPAWAPRVWPNLRVLSCICSGIFANTLPMARSVIGPDVVVKNPGFACTECLLAGPFNPEDTETLVASTKDIVEYLDVADNQIHENIRQVWDLQPGKLYQAVVTTVNGLWRYMLDDVFHVIGFDPRNGSPVFRYHGRKSLAIRSQYAIITEGDLMKVTQAINGDDNLRVQEFTTVLDRRELPETVGIILEIAGDTGPNANLARQKAFEALLSTNDDHQREFDAGRLRLPTIRIVKPGTFSDYRRWRGEKLNTGIGQIKVPVVMVDPASIEWLEERVVKEL